jgi:hypothetical protein
MTRLVPLALGLALLCAWTSSTARAADKKVDLTGTWEFTVDIAGQTGTPEFTFKQKGNELTGRYKGQFGEKDLTGTIKGKDIEFSFEIQEGAKAVYVGTVEKDGTMKGKTDYAGQASGEWTGKRKKEEKSDAAGS